MNGASCAAVHSPVPFADRRSRGDSMELANALRRIFGDRVDVRDLLQVLAKAGNQYRGVACKGVQALEMQVCGYTTREIAELYGVRSNVVAAWVSQARQMLKKDHTLSAG
mgnify:FL=1